VTTDSDLLSTSHKGTAPPAGSFDEHGLFARGNQAARGNPNAVALAQLRRVAREAGTPEKVKAVMDKLYAMFMDLSDLQAGIVWMQYTVGKPTLAVEVSTEPRAAIQTDIRAIVAIIQQEERDPEKRLRLARRILQLGQQTEVQPDGCSDGNGSAA
jgi:hypothetical protein